MEIKFSKEIDQNLKKLKRKDIKLLKRIEKQLLLFKKNPKHHSLRIHKLSGKLKKYWSISIAKNIRMIYFLQDNDVAYFIDIGTHDEVYQ